MLRSLLLSEEAEERPAGGRSCCDPSLIYHTIPSSQSQQRDWCHSRLRNPFRYD